MKLYIKRGVMSGFIITILVITILGVYAYVSIRKQIDAGTVQSRSLMITTYAEKVLVTIVDLETGQRGYVITGDSIYLDPYNNAVRSIDDNIALLRKLAEPFPEKRAKVDDLKRLVKQKMDFVKGTIEARNDNFEAARAKIAGGEGMHIMDQIRASIDDLRRSEEDTYNIEAAAVTSHLGKNQYLFTGALLVPAVIIVILFYAVNANLTQREEAVAQLQQANDDVTKVNRELESFTYSVSHDLRAPLRSVNGYANILIEDYGHLLDNHAKATIGIIARNGQKMGELIDDLLEYSRLGKKQVHRAPVSMNEVVHHVVDEISEGKNYPARVSIEIKDLPDANADAGMMRQVWNNLISNALKYSGKTENPAVEIGSFLRDNYVCYYVKDNGVGFNMAYVDKLFGIFQRLHKQDEFEGTGVGLALIRRIVDMHEGKVWAEGELNKGATFFFSLPR